MADVQDKLKALQKSFPKGTVGVLPKPYKKTSPKGKCQECGGYHGLPAAHLDFVGHAAVTDRLLSVDPTWTWEPLAFDERGLPALDRDGNLWIRLTVCGVTRIGVGDGPSMKERIGDALRNAAMRFGVALSLWTKDELESGHSEDKATDHGASAPQDATAAGSPKASRGQGGGDAGGSPLAASAPPSRTLRRAPGKTLGQGEAPYADPETGEIADRASTRDVNRLRALFAREHDITSDEDMEVVAAAALARTERVGLNDLTGAEVAQVTLYLKGLNKEAS